ncbi:MAG: hypothetical protein MO853_09905 [Candidatus Protistobacter heckmanni]|nr:hypothetical protein [Candidatus Protistobacter heckmanni]
MTEWTLIQPESGPQGQDRLRKLTHVLYALYALAWLTFGSAAIVAIIINYVKREDVRGTLYETHFNWQICAFWICVGVSIVAVPLMLVWVGFVLLWALGILALYRIIKGWLYLNDGCAIGLPSEVSM